MYVYTSAALRRVFNNNVAPLRVTVGQPCCNSRPSSMAQCTAVSVLRHVPHLHSVLPYFCKISSNVITTPNNLRSYLFPANFQKKAFHQFLFSLMMAKRVVYSVTDKHQHLHFTFNNILV